ncbi:hypothetical protein, partial [Pseudomonas aeruginosa]
MARHWQNLLRGMLENPQASVDSLPMLDAEERYQLLEGWNATAAEYPLQRGVHRLFEEQVARLAATDGAQRHRAAAASLRWPAGFPECRAAGSAHAAPCA